MPLNRTSCHSCGKIRENSQFQPAYCPNIPSWLSSIPVLVSDSPALVSSLSAVESLYISNFRAECSCMVRQVPSSTSYIGLVYTGFWGVLLSMTLAASYLLKCYCSSLTATLTTMEVSNRNAPNCITWEGSFIVVRGWRLWTTIKAWCTFDVKTRNKVTPYA